MKKILIVLAAGLLLANCAASKMPFSQAAFYESSLYDDIYYLAMAVSVERIGTGSLKDVEYAVIKYIADDYLAEYKRLKSLLKSSATGSDVDAEIVLSLERVRELESRLMDKLSIKTGGE